MELKRIPLWCLVWPYAARALVQAPFRRRPVGALGASTAKLPPAFTSGSDDRYADWRVDVAAFEASRSAPLVYVGESPGAGVGVFAKERIAAGTTVTEWVGCLAPTPDSRCEEMELQQDFYGPDWRAYSQRYEIGLAGSALADAGGVAAGGRLGDRAKHADDYCDVDEGLSACVARAGEMDWLLLGKVVAMGACAEEGVAQLINDHSAIHVATAAFGGGGGAAPDEPSPAADVDGLIATEGAVPVAVNVLALEAAVDDYISRIEALNNVALCQARTAGDDGVDVPRVFAVATRPIEAGAELRYTYGVEWWLSQLRRAALAQLVSCQPSPARAAALADAIRAIERLSLRKLDAQARSIGRAGSMPRGFVTPLEPLPPLDDLIGGDSWKRALLVEEFASATECPVEHLYAETFVPGEAE